jgi:hypothetical protein
MRNQLTAHRFFERNFMKNSVLLAVSTVVATISLAPIGLAQTAPMHTKDFGVASPMPAAHSLDTEAITIEALPLFAIDAPPMAHAPQVADAIPTASTLAPKPLTPAGLMQDPSTAWQRFMAQPPRQPKPIDPLGFFALPAMESGLKMNLMNF